MSDGSGDWHADVVLDEDRDADIFEHRIGILQHHETQIHGVPTSVFCARVPAHLGDCDKQDLPVAQYKEVLALHLGAAYHVMVPLYAPGDGGVAPRYEGTDDGVINMGRYLFTYEYLQSFLNQLLHGTTTFQGYLRQSLLDYDVACGDGRVRDRILSERRLLEVLSVPAATRPNATKLYTAFISAVLDYITLQDINYESELGCQCCSDKPYGPTVVMYDAACLTLNYSLARDPDVATHFRFFVDKFHHRSHTACSPFMSHSSDVATAPQNSAIMEQINRVLKHVALTASFLSQVTFLVLLRHVWWMCRLRRPPVTQRECDHIGWVFDGVQVNLGKRHAFVRGRTHTAPPGDATTRVGTEADFRGRLMIPAPNHRSALRRLVAAGTDGLPCDEAVHSFVCWLYNGKDKFGTSMSHYIRLLWDAPDDENESFEGMPQRDLSTVRVDPASLSSYKLCLLHWSSTTPEIQVLPASLVALARAWVEHGRLISQEDLVVVATYSPLLYLLLLDDAKTQSPAAGQFWELSDALTCLLRTMIWVVEKTLSRTEETVDPLTSTSDAGNVVYYELPTGVDRVVPTALETFLWHGELWPRAPVQRHVDRYEFDEVSRGGTRCGSRDESTCAKYPTQDCRPSTHGLMTASCARCLQLTGFSILTSPESPKAVFELLVTRFMGTTQDQRPPAAHRVNTGNVVLSQQEWVRWLQDTSDIVRSPRPLPRNQEEAKRRMHQRLEQEGRLVSHLLKQPSSGYMGKRLTKLFWECAQRHNARPCTVSPGSDTETLSASKSDEEVFQEGGVVNME